VLDVGCGRGTFLELLRERGIEAVGVDSSELAVETCRRKGFEQVYNDNALAFLESAEQQYMGIYCGHIIEHMAPDVADRLITLAWRALRPGGRLVLVTPNPLDLRVMSEYFWLDTTHVRPYPLVLLKSMLRSVGFASISGGYFQSTRPGRRQLPRYMLLRLLLGRYYGLSDTFVVGTKA
jgi:2-polyprenyl-3-methyl-5-hydroxy-6-metoxy-1,4-benzoquinol methylase